MPDILMFDKLTPTEDRVLGLIAEGFTNEAIAQRLYIAERTAVSHFHRIISKIDVPEDMNKRVWIALHAHELRDKKYLSEVD